ncbi:hypothetical protein B9Z19DRAFT_1077932, partial [Tuber borchii]
TLLLEYWVLLTTYIFSHSRSHTNPDATTTNTGSPAMIRTNISDAEQQSYPRLPTQLQPR